MNCSFKFFPLISLLGLALIQLGCSTTPTQLGHQAPFMAEKDKTVPRQLIIVSFPGGAYQVPKKLQGLPSVLTEILEKGPKGMPAKKYRKKLFLLNSDINFVSADRAIHAMIRAPSDNINQATRLMKKIIDSPKIKKKTFQRARSKVLASARSRFDSMRAVILYYGMKDAFDYHPDTLSASGSPKSVANLKMEHIKNYNGKLLELRNASLTSVGPLNPQKLKERLDQQFKDVKPYRKPEFSSPSADNYRPEKRKITLIHQEGAQNNQILYIYPKDIPFGTQAWVNGKLAHKLLGGGLTSRLSRELRKKRGLTYHVGTSLSETIPAWSVYTFGSPKKTKPLLKGIKSVLKNFKASSFSKKEVQQASKILKTDFKKEIELPKDRLLKKLEYRLYDRPMEFIQSYPELLEKGNPQSIKNFAQKYLNHKKGYLYLMGDKAHLLPL